MKTMNDKVIFRVPHDELAAFKRRISSEGLTISLFFRMSMENYLKSYGHGGKEAPVSIPFCGCLRDEHGDYRDRAAEYVLGR